MRSFHWREVVEQSSAGAMMAVAFMDQAWAVVVVFEGWMKV